MSIKVAIANHKGGVGKSTSTMMIAEGLALFFGQRVLVFDLDAQGMISRMLMSQAALDLVARERRTMIDLLRNYASGRAGALPYCIAPRVSDLAELRRPGETGRIDLVPSHPQALAAYREVEDQLQRAHSGSRPDVVIARMVEADLQRVADYYDVVLFDCSAGLSPTSLAALRLSSVVIAPTMLERNSINALLDFLRIILSGDLGRDGQITQRIHVLMTMFIRSNPAQQLLFDTIQRGMQGLNAISTPVAHSVAIQRAVLHPGEGGSRLAREKYNSSYGELQALANAIFTIVSAPAGPRRNPQRAEVGR